MLKRFWVMFIARNKEFYRDRATFGWNFMFPFLILLGFYMMFQRGEQTVYKIGVIPETGLQSQELKSMKTEIPEYISDIRLFKFIRFAKSGTGFDRLKHHKLDLIFEPGSDPLRYWINESSPTGIIAESLLLSSVYLKAPQTNNPPVRQTVSGKRIHYIDWLFPGILSMNMMFSALFGIGYVIVRYRKNGVLKRLKVTPLNAFEYLLAQVISRTLVIVASAAILFVGCAMIFKFECKGSYFDLICLFSLGSVCMISLGLLVAARSSSEEFANGVVTLITWPMMFLSEVWFSIEGSPAWVKSFSNVFPLKHVTESMRMIMNEGAGLSEVQNHIMILSIMTVAFILISSVLFKWTED